MILPRLLHIMFPPTICDIMKGAFRFTLIVASIRWLAAESQI
jgi:hypothetical protein